MRGETPKFQRTRDRLSCILNTLSSFFAVCSLFLMPPSLVFAGYLELDTVADVKTQFSDGCSSIGEMANIAQLRNIDVVIYSDHYNDSVEYGFRPFENIFKKREKHPSVLSQEVENYLSAIKDGAERIQDVIMIPAVEVAPFYYWSGKFSEKNLSINGLNKHLLVVGLQTVESYKQIPVLDGNFSTRYTRNKINNFILYVVIFIICVTFVYKRVFRKVTVFLAFFSLLLAYNHHPFQSSLYDPYHGDRGIKPYQDLIDYATSNGAMVFWNHIESKSGTESYSWAKSNTPPHPEDLVLSGNYTGFEAVDDEPVHAADSGKEWDHVLTQFIQGKRKAPVWGYGGNDFHCEDRDNHKLGGVRTILLATARTPSAALEAMLHGRMYSVRQASEDDSLRLERFMVSSGEAGREAVSGEELATLNAPEIKIKIKSTKSDNKPVKISIIRNGELVKEDSGFTPYILNWQDTDVVRKGKAYYRIKAESGNRHYLLSNPIFVRFSELPLETALVPLTQTPKTQEFKIPTPPQAPAAPKLDAPSVTTPNTPTVQGSEDATAPSLPAVSEPRKPEIAGKLTDSGSDEMKLQYVTPRVDAVALKTSPDTSSAQVGTINKGERLLLVGRTTILYNDKPWLIVKKGNLTAFVWEPLVNVE